MTEAQMQLIGEIDGRKFYFADKSFAEPGIYYWDGTTNVRAWPTPPVPQRLAQGEQVGHITLNQVQKDALYGVMSNLEHDAGDIDDLAPDKEKDEDGYWAYHAWHAINKLRGGDNSHYTAQPPHHDRGEVDSVAKIIADHVGHGMREKCETVAAQVVAALTEAKQQEGKS